MWKKANELKRNIYGNELIHKYQWPDQISMEC